jgi:riboflavin kinase/FMN adenylyltransferase
MRVLRGDPAGWPFATRPRALTVGVFDGVHAGHRHVIGLLQTMAADRGLAECGVVTFDPHPLRVVDPGRAPRMLTTVEQRLELFESLGLDVAAVLPFDGEVRSRTAAAFAGGVLGEALGARLVVVGEDFRFGRDRTGNVASLGELGDAHGFETCVVPLVGSGDRPVSSTVIRRLVAAGEVAAAAEALARPFELPGRVVPGDGRGSTIGFPTANLALPGELVIPGRGVYAVGVRLPDGDDAEGVVNVGVRPTFGGGDRYVEVHVFDVRRDLYDQELRVRFVERIRDERRFDGVDELVAQIHRDVAAARTIMSRG